MIELETAVGIVWRLAVGASPPLPPPQDLTALRSEKSPHPLPHSGMPIVFNGM
jgi:hypothetical protein